MQYVVFLNQKPQKTASKSAIETGLQEFSRPFSIVEGSAKTGAGVEDLLRALKGSVGFQFRK